jgi:hypothetical protein
MRYANVVTDISVGCKNYGSIHLSFGLIPIKNGTTEAKHVQFLYGDTINIPTTVM